MEIESQERQSTEALRNALQELKLENSELRNFAFMACHDLQAPLRYIRLYIDNLSEGLEGQPGMENSENQYSMKVIRDGAVKMQALIDNLMILSGVENSELVPESVDMNVICSRLVTTLLEGAVDDRVINIQWGRLPTVQGSPDEIFQVLMNLCANGLKYQKPGAQPVLDIAVESHGDFWRVYVKDNGIGIEDLKNRDQIFKPFVRMASAEHHPGLGLGLSICQKIVQRHRGEFFVEANPSGGSLFSFTLPKAF